MALNCPFYIVGEQLDIKQKRQNEEDQKMKRTRSVIALVLTLVLILALSACGTTAPATVSAEPSATSTEDTAKVGQTVLKCAFNQTIENPEAKTLQKLSDDLYDATEGRYSIEVYPDAQLGDQAQTLEQCTAGALDMTLVANSIIETYDSDFAILGTPYVYDSVEHQEKVFESGKLDDLYATTQQYGFNVLSAYSLGPRNLYTRDKAVTTPAELSGMKIRVMGSDTCIAMMNAMGGVGVAMAQGDVYSAIQTKTLDGAENNIITYVDLLQYEVAPYYNYTGHLMIPDELCINSNVLASMSEADQAALKKVATESIPYMFDLCETLRADYEAKAKKAGVIFSDADVAAFQACCADLIQEVANRTDMTKSVYDAIVSLK
jgi:tripartite ATP-independent transporter DctP family solute receptor